MEFKAGDRVHVTRYCYENVDFYATLYKIWDERWESEYFRIADCSNKTYEGFSICKPSPESYGLNKSNYYTLATDEEDSELLTIEHDELIKDIEKLKEEKAAIEMYLDAVKVYKPMYEEVNRKYNKLTEHIRLKALHNPSISRYIDLVCFINEMEDK